MMRLEEFLAAVSEIRKESIDEGCSPISEADAAAAYSITYLHSLYRGCVNVVEIGSCVGYSTAWLARAIEDSGASGCSRVVGIEAKRVRAEKARNNMWRLGLAGLVDIIAGDAIKVLRSLDFRVDLLFINASKGMYLKYLELVEDRIPRGGMVLAHNVLASDLEGIRDFLEKVSDRSRWVTTILPTSAGISLSIKL